MVKRGFCASWKQEVIQKMLSDASLSPSSLHYRYHWSNPRYKPWLTSILICDTQTEKQPRQSSVLTVEQSTTWPLSTNVFRNKSWKISEWQINMLENKHFSFTMKWVLLSCLLLISVKVHCWKCSDNIWDFVKTKGLVLVLTYNDACLL